MRKLGCIGIGMDQDEEIEFPLDEIELKKNDPNYRLISDYTYWFKYLAVNPMRWRRQDGRNGSPGPRPGRSPTRRGRSSWRR